MGWYKTQGVQEGNDVTEYEVIEDPEAPVLGGENYNAEADIIGRPVVSSFWKAVIKGK